MKRQKYSDGITPNYLRSKEMACSMCLELVYKKGRPEHRQFGILPNCNHCHCLDCIRTWKKISRSTGVSCPLCRTMSYFYVPSPYWIEDEDSKQQMIKRFKEDKLRTVCPYGETCLAGSRCLYKHDKPTDDVCHPQTTMVWPLNTQPSPSTGAQPRPMSPWPLNFALAVTSTRAQPRTRGSLPGRDVTQPSPLTGAQPRPMSPWPLNFAHAVMSTGAQPPTSRLPPGRDFTMSSAMEDEDTLSFSMTEMIGSLLADS